MTHRHSRDRGFHYRSQRGQEGVAYRRYSAVVVVRSRIHITVDVSLYPGANGTHHVLCRQCLCGSG